MGTKRILRVAAVATVLAVSFGACGGKSPTSPGNPPPSGGNVITITSAGVSPKEITVSPGTRVQFVNNDSVRHQMNSDPHPAHTDCQEINQVGSIQPGQTKETGNLNTVRTCGYHDHDLFPQSQWMGRIIVR